jgi:hypothetical protein
MMYFSSPILSQKKHSIYFDDVPTRTSDKSTDIFGLRVMPVLQKRASTYLETPDEIIPWGFGFEFEQCLQAKWQDDLDRQEARLERYGRFGIDAEDARHRTPEDMREAYRSFVQAELDDVHTPTPSPSAEPMPRIPAQISRECRGPRDSNASLRRSSVPKKRKNRHGSRTERKGNSCRLMLCKRDLESGRKSTNDHPALAATREYTHTWTCQSGVWHNRWA